VKEPNMFHNCETEKITRKTREPAIIAGGTTKQHVIIILTCCSVVPPKKITHKASDMAENLQL